jgi:hypothetical protein
MRSRQPSLKRLKIEKMIRSTLSTLTKQTMGRILLLTSTKQRSITLVVRRVRHRWGETIETEQLGQIAPQPFHHRGIGVVRQNFAVVKFLLA